MNEFQFINFIKSLESAKVPAPRGIGDDCAVFPLDRKRYYLVSTDSMVENVHFKFQYSRPRQIGIKSISVSISDVAAMGGKPLYVLLDIQCPNTIKDSELKEFAVGVDSACKKYGIKIIGGNTVRGSIFSVSVTVIGTVLKNCIKLRSGARQGDLIFVTGQPGRSALGFELLKKGFLTSLSRPYISSHLDPQVFVDVGIRIGKQIGVHSMIDVSDGISSEIHHLCKASGVGAVIRSDLLKYPESMIRLCRKIHKHPVDFYLHGGEGYELLFTGVPEVLGFLQRKGVDCCVIGEIVSRRCGVNLLMNGRLLALKYQGFMHF